MVCLGVAEGRRANAKAHVEKAEKAAAAADVCGSACPTCILEFLRPCPAESRDLLCDLRPREILVTSAKVALSISLRILPQPVI